ncbi:hypothetical protein MSP7336_01787 [Mycobacterium shimoidei]|uniref:Peptidoglycan binding-like domain-containing protein n=1 Tax=Mycobacterium shimoidei TaxID=29313 RepID=A0A375YXF7_MYCSH|nr:peptidoglycan-binding domain-containing protein [Mycobacterium shimoidei]SRX93549.1 hypothetical protein MSP7336_01787 [Mycobacterium shimoidei]
MPLPYKLGDHGPEITSWQQWFDRMYHSYAPPIDGYYGNDEVAAVSEMQRRLHLPVTGVFDANTAHLAGYYEPAPQLPIFFTVEGHLSNMFAGPVADTAAKLEAEGLCHHQPIGYNNAAVPFDNASGQNELARLFGQPAMDNKVPFPLGTKYILGGFSQGMIVVTDFIVNCLQPGQIHEPRAKDCLGVLAYGNPCRSRGSAAPWSVAQAGPPENAGMDPKVRFDLLGIHLPYPVMDVYRRGDIFSDNEPTQEGAVKSAVYEAAARGDFFSNPYSICAQIANLFATPFQEVWAIFEAIVSGVEFLAAQPNPHYAPFDIDGGIDWARGLLTAA